MNYSELAFSLPSSEDYQRDLLIHALAEIGFETFEETEHGFKAYIPSGNYDQGKLNESLQPFDNLLKISYQFADIPEQNWNEVWESNFGPILIGEECYIRATFHQPRPEFRYEIVIDPKMAFGTGHHQTTALMAEQMLKEDFKNRHVLDMGCGTGILAVLAHQLGATDIVAIDNDPVCYQSTVENSLLNHAEGIKALCGSKDVIPAAKKFDIILANINRNVLADQVAAYSEALVSGGLLFLSGFFKDPDLNILIEKAARFNIRYLQSAELDNWVCAKFIR